MHIVSVEGVCKLVIGKTKLFMLIVMLYKQTFCKSDPNYHVSKVSSLQQLNLGLLSVTNTQICIERIVFMCL